jgi:tetratricopeptide (TPR) repeat protein
MGATLSLFDHLLARGRRYRASGRLTDSIRVLERLALAEPPADVAEQAHALLAEAFLKGGRYRRAKSHLTTALDFAPDNARYEYLLARACRALHQVERALAHYRRSLEQEPNQVRCLTEYGLLLVRGGQTDEGLERLREAVEMAPHDPLPIARLVRGLRLAGRPDEARTAARTALFRNGRSLEFLQIWRDLQFREAARRQTMARPRKARRGKRQANVLPFVRIAAERKTGIAVRQDAPAVLSAPHFPHSARRHVQ